MICWRGVAVDEIDDREVDEVVVVVADDAVMVVEEDIDAVEEEDDEDEEELGAVTAEGMVEDEAEDERENELLLAVVGVFWASKCINELLFAACCRIFFDDDSVEDSAEVSPTPILAMMLFTVVRFCREFCCRECCRWCC